ncbi:MAG: prepilin-type N-terminal cleavage/methylation domain-containing protein [Candidatus Saccharibacteria bacterium]
MKKGFTLIETLLYMAILSVVIVALSSFLFLSYTSRVKASVIAEVEQQGSQTLNLITQNIRNSASITAPALGNSGASLTLTEYAGANSPTVFDQSGNTMRITEGASAAVNITSNRVVVSNLSFQNLTRFGTPGNVKVSFTLTHINPDNRGEYIYSKNFTATASLRYP